MTPTAKLLRDVRESLKAQHTTITPKELFDFFVLVQADWPEWNQVGKFIGMVFEYVLKDQDLSSNTLKNDFISGWTQRIKDLLAVPDFTKIESLSEDAFEALETLRDYLQSPQDYED